MNQSRTRANRSIVLTRPRSYGVPEFALDFTQVRRRQKAEQKPLPFSSCAASSTGAHKHQPAPTILCGFVRMVGSLRNKSSPI
jgi:hypothetical protein